MDAAGWDQRYAASPSVWPAGPNVWVRELTQDLPPGRALDLAAGEGRHALWLAARGWDVTAVDFSAVALERARALARHQGLTERVALVRADAVSSAPPGDPFDLVVVAYLQLARDALARALRHAAGAVAPHGTLVLVAHDTRNLTEGTGGPQDSAVLYGPADVAPVLADAGLEVWLAETRSRAIAGADRAALDAVVAARRRGPGPTA